jgi:hypothetical protein
MCALGSRAVASCRDVVCPAAVAASEVYGVAEGAEVIAGQCAAQWACTLWREAVLSLPLSVAEQLIDRSLDGLNWWT